MKDKISRNVKGIEISGIRRFSNKVSKYPKVISLTLGQPDFNVPSKAKEAMIRAINENKTTYTSNQGLLSLREEISNYLKRLGINYSKEEVCITVGGSEGLFASFAGIINEGDKVLIPAIAYPAYESCTKILGGTVINYKLNVDFSLDIDYLEKLIKKEKPKALVLSYPCNPTGSILSLENRDKLFELIKENDILVITDEIYSSIYYKDTYYSIAQCEDIRDKIILVNGFSKIFSMTGLRIGYFCATGEIFKNLMKVHQYNVSCAPSISQYAALEGLKSCMEDVEHMKNEFQKRRDYVYNRLNSMGLDVIKPEGAFYIFPNISKYNISSEEFCDRLLDKYRVAMVPGSAFGEGGEGYIRISYSYSTLELKKALDELEKFINEN
ncbi:pyridoxal phosphate-dependent aminotransferase [Haloimpatiens sp. FM7315]|uniref:pyridoxal phosphate-dependent aminotransferase n=1 Tax=Haloimpatiens sp. FM7315 TaxID=3298609 RepID=UPI00370A6DC2